MFFLGLLLSFIGWAAFIRYCEPAIFRSFGNELIRSDIHAAGSAVLSVASLCRVLPDVYVSGFMLPYMTLDGLEKLFEDSPTYELIVHHIACIVCIGISFASAGPGSVGEYRLISWCTFLTELSTLPLNHWERQSGCPSRYCAMIVTYLLHRVILGGLFLYATSGPYQACLNEETAGVLDYIFIWVSRVGHSALCLWWYINWKKYARALS